MHRAPAHRLTAMTVAIVTLVLAIAFSIPAAAAGSPWQTVPSATLPADTYATIYGVTMITPNDVWTVGQVSDAVGQRTLAEHWNGTKWSVVPTPNPGGQTGGYYLNAVAAVSANDVWAVGSNFNSGYLDTAVIEHWNGTKWSLVPAPPYNSLNRTGGAYNLEAVSPVSTNDVWAVGDDNVIEHWNGTKWSVVPTPAFPNLTVLFHSVTAIAANDVWAVGSTSRRTNQSSLIEHWDGVRWSVVAHPAAGFFAGVAAVATNDVWAVGGSTIEHWNGTQWSVVPTANPNDITLHSVAIVGPKDVWAVGVQRSIDASGIHHDATLTEQWNGTQWHHVPSPDVGDDNAYGLVGVAAVPSGTLWAIMQPGIFLRNTTG